MHYSVVIPLKNEAENIADLIEEIEPVMEGLKRSWELICIDDGSTDATFEILKQLVEKKTYLRVLKFASNLGQSAAFKAGFQAARGDIVITLDGDRQNDPEDIPKLTSMLADCDLVVGWRINRRDPWNKRIISRLSNAIRSRLCGDEVHDTGCSLKAYRKSALDQIKMYRGMHRFLPALFINEGFRVKEVPVHHRERTSGVTKYNFFNRSVGPIIDMFAVRWMRKRTLRLKIQEEISGQ